MKNKEFEFQGKQLNGIAMLIVTLLELDDDKKAAMVCNLMVILCGEESAQPVVNTGTPNH